MMSPALVSTLTTRSFLRLIRVTARAVLTSTLLDFGKDHDYVLCVETEFQFRDADQSLLGHFLLLPDLPSLDAILNAIRVR